MDKMKITLKEFIQWKVNWKDTRKCPFVIVFKAKADTQRDANTDTQGKQYLALVFWITLSKVFKMDRVDENNTG